MRFRSDFDRLPLRKKKISAVLIVVACVAFSVYTWALYTLEHQGTITTGHLERKYTSEIEHTTTYNLAYTFSPTPGQVASGDGLTTREDYARFKPGDTIPVRYLASNPRVSQPWNGREDWYRSRIKAAIVMCGLSILAAIGMVRNITRPEDVRAQATPAN